MPCSIQRRQWCAPTRDHSDRSASTAVRTPPTAQGQIYSSWWLLPVGWLEIGDTVGSVFQITVGFSSPALSFFLSLYFFPPPPPPRGRSKVVKAVGVGYYKISGVVYQNMKGNSAIKGAMTLECSASNPCKGIRLQDIKLTYYEKSSIAYCEHVHGSTSGVVMPRSCL